MYADQTAVFDPLLPQARELLLAEQNPSVAFLQRQFRIGYPRALRLMRSMEGDIVTVPNAEGWRQMLHTGNMSSSDPRSSDYKPED